MLQAGLFCLMFARMLCKRGSSMGSCIRNGHMPADFGAASRITLLIVLHFAVPLRFIFLCGHMRQAALHVVEVSNWVNVGNGGFSMNSSVTLIRQAPIHSYAQYAVSANKPSSNRNKVPAS